MTAIQQELLRRRGWTAPSDPSIDPLWRRGEYAVVLERAVVIELAHLGWRQTVQHSATSWHSPDGRTALVDLDAVCQAALLAASAPGADATAVSGPTPGTDPPGEPEPFRRLYEAAMAVRCCPELWTLGMGAIAASRLNELHDATLAIHGSRVMDKREPEPAEGDSVAAREAVRRWLKLPASAREELCRWIIRNVIPQGYGRDVSDALRALPTLAEHLAQYEELQRGAIRRHNRRMAVLDAAVEWHREQEQLSDLSDLSAPVEGMDSSAACRAWELRCAVAEYLGDGEDS